MSDPQPVSDVDIHETLALLKILELGNQQLEEGKVSPLAEVCKRIRSSRARKSTD